MVVKGGKENEKETASLGRLGKRKKKKKGGKEVRKWRQNRLLDGGAGRDGGKRRKGKRERSGKRKKKEKGGKEERKWG